MGKPMIFSEKEWHRMPLKKQRELTYTDSYVIDFWIENDKGYWEPSQAQYYTDGKGEHDAICQRWKRDYSGQRVHFVKVTYE